jgi:hypothetical protein
MIRKLFWVLSEGPGGPSWRHKYYEVPYRSPLAQQSAGAKGLRHEHVLPLKLAVDIVLEDPRRALEVADEITICIVTRDEATPWIARLPQVGIGTGMRTSRS